MKKVICFARVSTTAQDLKPQLDAVKRQIIADGYKESEIAEVKGKESAIKLKEEERQTLNEMKQLISDYPTIEAVYFFAVDRLARRMSVVMSVKEWADENNIILVFLNPQPMYTFIRNEKGELIKNDLTDLLLAMLSYGAMMEMRIKQERFKTSKESLRAAGKVSVGKPMYGYYKAADKSIQINDDEADVISNLFEDYLNTSTSLKLLYENYVAKGKLSNIKGGAARLQHLFEELGYSGRNERIKYPAIVTPEIQDAVIKKMKSNKSQPKNSQHNVFLAKGLLYDSATDCTMTGSGNRGVYRTHVGKLEVVNINAVDSILWFCAVKFKSFQLANMQISLSDSYKKEISDNEATIDNLSKMLEDNSRKQKIALDRLLAGKVSEAIYNRTADDLIEEAKKFEASIVKAKNNINRLKRLLKVESKQSFDAKQQNLEEITDDLQRQQIIQDTVKKAIMERVSGTEKIITVIPKHRYRIETFLPRKYVIRRGQACVKIFEIWVSASGREIEIPFTGKFYERYTKDKQGNYKYNKVVTAPPTILDD